ncbi:hypothetical protein [Hydrogenophaga taeniospiralis]|uniref:hypothetical protein n=1 Tax=Hydrogenophaga taeniospiralis TaxID=65656 RepID=UPI001CFB9109|nr:hypothetical protein [Hydrogenophaga taeniospiralis]UCU95205.1 hypothetical protein KI616_04905 [Hydrogenophaga taeniospiralis]
MQIVKFILALLVASWSIHAGAQVHQSRGNYSLNYKEHIGTFDKREAPSAIKQKARQEATFKAIEAYYAQAGQSESANFNAIRSAVMADVERYVLDAVVISENDDPKDYQYSVVVRVSLNMANLRNAVQGNAAVSKAAEGEKSALSFVFVSRMVDSIKSYDDRVFKRSDSSADDSLTVQKKNMVREKTSEGESFKGGSINTFGSATGETDASARVSAKSSVSSETGGSTVKRSSESAWRLFPSANLNQVFVSEFSQAGYDVIEAAMVDSGKFKMADVESDYKSGNDLQPITLRAIAAGMREAEIPYIALGTLDVGWAEKDPQTGLMRVSVTVNAKVWDVSKAIPRTRVAVGPVSYAGVGPTEDEARGSALRSAATSTAQELSSRMATMGIR